MVLRKNKQDELKFKIDEIHQLENQYVKFVEQLNSYEVHKHFLENLQDQKLNSKNDKFN